jgi:3-deoxy-manno-octulosonate cytidylyltransferase (CMP-KDO synthetase)
MKNYKTDVRTLGVIPVRYESTRLPGKALLEIHGRPMVHWVYERARQSAKLESLLVATDSELIFKFCEEAGIPVLLTGKHPSGSDRLYEVLTRTEADIYVNIQGDEPTISPGHIDLLLEPFASPEVQVTTLKVEIDSQEALNPNAVKVVTDCRGKALYFSRAPIPYPRGAEPPPRYFKHIGLYAFRREALEMFHKMEQTPLELSERLEQLRFIENGVPILVIETDQDTIGVDTAEDLKRASELMAKSGRIPQSKKH